MDPLLSSGARGSLEPDPPTARHHRFGARKFRHRTQEGRIAAAFLLWASLSVLPSIAGAREAGVRRAAAQTSADSTPTRRAQSDVPELEPGKSVDRSLAGGQSHSYRVTLASGQFLHLDIESRRIGLIVTLVGPDGKPTRKFTVSEGSSEPLFLVAAETGSYRMEIRTMEGPASGSYRAEMDELRVATPRDNNRARAQAAFEDGEHLREEGSGESQQKAVEKYEQSLSLWTAAVDRLGSAKALDGLGSLHRDLDENPKALEYLNQALEQFRAVGDRAGQARTLHNIGGVYDSLGERKKALDVYGQALTLRRAVGDRSGEAQTLNNMGETYDWLGERQKALDHYLQALPLRRAVGDRDGEAETLNNIGVIHDMLGEKQTALEYFGQALTLVRRAGDRYGEGTTLHNIGLLYAMLGETQKALNYYNQALPLRRAVGNRRGESYTLNSIGAIYEALGQTQKALDTYEQALVLGRAVKDRSGQARTLSLIGLVYDSLGQKQKALDYYDQTLTLVRAVGDRPGEAITLDSLGRLYDALGERQKALDSYDQALTLLRAVGDRQGESTTLGHLAAVESKRGNLDRARTRIEEAIQMIESLRSSVLSEKVRASYFSTVQANYTLYIDLLMRLQSLHPDEGNQAKALEVSERARARILLEILVEAQADIRRGVDPALLERERNLGQLLKGKEAARIRLLHGQHSEEEATALEKDMEEILGQYEQVEAQIRAASPRYAELKQPQALTALEIQQQLDANTLLLEYSLGEERSFLWAVGPDSLDSFELPKRADLEDAARRFYALLTARNRRIKFETDPQRTARLARAEAQYPEVAAGLSRMLLGPVAGFLKADKLLIVSDGALQYIPFSALPEPSVEIVNRRRPTVRLESPIPLIVRHEIIGLPSASALAVLKRETLGRPPASKIVAILADPVFDREDARVGRAIGRRPSAVPRPGQATGEKHARKDTETGSLSASLAKDRLTRSASEVGSTLGGQVHFPRLAFTRREAQAILAEAPPGKGMMAVDFMANLQTATDPALADYRIVHFATHGLLNSEHPELSGLVLSLVDSQGRPREGFLQLPDVYNLNLPADLVVLSACETGLGKEIRGEGLIGLTRGFMYAGAARMLVSLWEVDDQATSQLMSRFYKELLGRGRTPAAALRAAQISIAKQQLWRAPYYWAAFVLQGLPN